MDDNLPGMCISSFVVTLPEEPAAAGRIVAALAAVPVFELGDAVERRLPVVLEAEDGSAARQWYEWVEALPGVVKVDMAFVSFEACVREEEV
jgi:nitrate reductase NapAB chaperone NapD